MAKKSPKVIRNNKKNPDKEAIVKELNETLEKMEADRDAKLKAAKDQLVEMLQVTSDKYRTATGTAEALRVLRFVTDGKIDLDDDIESANSLALYMAEKTLEMKEKAKSLPFDQMDQLCDGFYEKDFDLIHTDTDETEHATILAIEMMLIDLCRNVGGAAQDMVDFCARIKEEIAATEAKLAELLQEPVEEE